MASAWPIAVTLMLIGDKVHERWRNSLFISFSPRRCFYPEISIWFKSFKLSSRHGFHHPVNLMGVPIHQVPSWSWRPSPPSSNRHNSQKISSRHGLSWIPWNFHPSSNDDFYHGEWWLDNHHGGTIHPVVDLSRRPGSGGWPRRSGGAGKIFEGRWLWAAGLLVPWHGKFPTMMGNDGKILGKLWDMIPLRFKKKGILGWLCDDLAPDLSLNST